MNQCLIEHQTKSARQKVHEPPPLYVVFLYDTARAPLEFIVEVVRIFFFFSLEKAMELIENIPSKRGKVICGVYTKDVAETKVQQVNKYLKKYRYVLKCGMEQTTENMEDGE